MTVGDTEKLTATILPENVDDNTLEWYWSDAGVVNIDENGNVTLYYLAYNFYWKEITFSLPYLPLSAKWDVVFSTGDVKVKGEETEETKQGMKFELESRSCSVFKVSFNKSVLNNK